MTWMLLAGSRAKDWAGLWILSGGNFQGLVRITIARRDQPGSLSRPPADKKYF